MLLPVSQDKVGVSNGEEARWRICSEEAQHNTTPHNAARREQLHGTRAWACFQHKRRCSRIHTLVGSVSSKIT